ncbi:methyltransferase PMT11 isoform X2 [Populus alba x Populus x berolinensis]|uniref:Methyltransferase n=2 Tax=Populus alba x Populus x berolinensis TaxID=444605 RepID=A0AAD6MEZ0_9ROSI|nr:methyltransferase PMT11 isoform X2 [Populus alba x Populus x berolinensis]
MKPLINTDFIKTPQILKITAFALISITFFYLGKHWSNSGYQQLLFFSTPQNSISISPNNDKSFNITSLIPLIQSDHPPTEQAITPTPPSIYPPPDESPLSNPNRTFGIIDSDGKMTDDFEVGEFDPDIAENWGNETGIESASTNFKVRVRKYELCPGSMREYIPCLDNVEAIKRLKLTEKGERFERHCPEKGKGLNCLVPPPKGYRQPIPWPRSRDEVWYSNVPHTRLVDDKGGQNWISKEKEKFKFPGGGTQFIHGADKYLDQIAQPSCVRLLCANERFMIQDGILLLEVNRMLRAGGYFAWAAQPVYKHEQVLEEQWAEMLNLTTHLCWELVKKEGYIAIWRKPLNNGCYLSRDTGAIPPLCDPDDDPDNVWYVDLKACISRLPENGYGANVPTWPSRLHTPPDRLQSIQYESYIARKELLKAESKFWSETIAGYVRAWHWKKFKLRNVMDMKAGFGGFAAALIDQGFDCWVLNVVPVSGSNTLPVLYDRGLLGVMHDWYHSKLCEPFDTYPRTYDLLHAAGLFSVERKRCNMSTIMLEMDRILRPGGRVYIRDSLDVMDELLQIAKAMGWQATLRDTSEGPHASYRILTCDKRLLRP